MKYALLFIIICPLTGFPLLGQSPVSSSEAVPEQMYVHWDKPFYAAGETLWYKVYFLNEDTSTIQSHVVYVEVIDPAGTLVMQQKLKRTHRYAFGDFNIPFTWKEGYYLFRCYTLWNLNFGEEAVFSKLIPIYDPWKEEDQPSPTPPMTTASDAQQTMAHAQPQEQHLRIVLHPDNDVYHRNEKVVVTIEVTDTHNHPVEASLSLSVTDTDLIPLADSVHMQPQNPDNLHATRQETSQNMSFAPEKALSLQGEVLQPNTTQPVTTQFLSVFFVEKQTFFNTSIANGHFHMTSPDFYGTQTLQIHDHNPFQNPSPQVKIRRVSDLLPAPVMPTALPPRNPDIERYLHLSRLRHKLDEVFNIDLPEPASSTENPVPLLNPDKQYLMKDFQLLKNVEEFIDHVFPKARTSEKNGQKTVRLFDPITQRYFEDRPWYMVNGFLTTQEDAVLKMPVNSIERLDVFFRRNTLTKQFPPLMIRNGVIAIYTRDGQTPAAFINESNTFSWQGFYQPGSFTFTGHPAAKAADKVPDFRPLVYWKPDIVTDASGKATVTFLTSEAMGRFRMYVEGVAKNGKAGSSSATYQVPFLHH